MFCVLLNWGRVRGEEGGGALVTKVVRLIVSHALCERGGGRRRRGAAKAAKGGGGR